VTREERLATTFVELADSLVEQLDVVELMTLLTERSIELLGAAAAGLLLADPLGSLQLIAATSQAAETVEAFQVQNDEGPCHQCILTGRPIDAPDLSAAAHRWPRFVPVAAACGFRAAHAVPMRLRGQVLGALDLFHAEPAALGPADRVAAQALADVATIALITTRAARDSQIVVEQLRAALASRVAIEQAKGVLAERLGCGVDEAFVRLRRHARRHGRRLSEVAAEISRGRLTI
jgi:GAF domain-containing protein